MRLTRVVYKFFESDAQWLDADPHRAFHILDREIQLAFENAIVHVSWKQAAAANGEIYFSIACQEESFFVNEPVVRDMSEHAFWKPLVGTDIELIFQDSEHTVLELKGTHHSVFCAAYEEGNWGVDVVHVSVAIPPAA
jgi:hypothetical protein